MSIYRVTAHAEGTAEIMLVAESEAEAELKAYAEHLTGITIDGGSSEWHIDTIEEANPDV